VHRKRVVVETVADRARVDEPLANVRFRERGELAARRAFEIGELDDLHWRIRFAEEVSLWLTRDDLRGVHRGRDVLWSARDVCERPDPEQRDDGYRGVERSL